MTAKLAAMIKKYREMELYIIFGALTTAVNYLFYYIFAHPLGISVVWSNIAAWALSVLFAFVTNKLLVFGSASLRPAVVLGELAAFVACRLFSGALDTGIMVLFVDALGFNDLVIKLLSNVAVIIINYVFSKFFIFAGKKAPAAAPKKAAPGEG
jgi:putative flippase GtrA